MDFQKFMADALAVILPALMTVITLATGFFVLYIKAWFDAKTKAIKDAEDREKAKAAVLTAADSGGDMDGISRRIIATDVLAKQAGISNEDALPMVRAAYQTLLNDEAFPKITDEKIQRSADILLKPPENSTLGGGQ